MLSRVETIFWCPSDLLVGVGISLILFSYLDAIQKHIFPCIILGITILFCHPLAIFPLIFKVGYDAIVSKKYKAFDLSFFLSLVLLWLLRNIAFGHWYINAKRNTLGYNVLNYQWEFWTVDANSQFVNELINQYMPLSLLILLIVIYHFYKKEFKSILFSILFSFFYIQLVNYTNATQASSFYREASYIPFLFFFIYPISMKTLTNKWEVFFRYAILILIVGNIYNTINHTKFFVDRTEQIKTVLANQTCQKSINKSIDLGNMQWGLPYESLLLSSITKESKTVISRPIDNSSPNQTNFLGAFRNQDMEDLNKDYFNLTAKPYCKD